MTAHRARSEKLFRFLAVMLIASLLSVSGLAIAQAEPAEITQAEKEAQQLRGLIDELDADLSKASEDYNYAAQQLEDTRAAETETQTRLTKAESQLDDARARLLTRLAEIYKAGKGSALEVLVGATSFSDLVSRARQLSRISQQDGELVAQVQDYVAEIEQHQAVLAEQEQDEKEQLDNVGKAKEEVEAQLAAQQKALEGKEVQVAQLREEEQARQAELAAAARAAAKAAAEAESAARARAATSVTEAPANSSPARSTTTTAAQSSTATTKPKTTTTTTNAPAPDPASPPSSGGSNATGTRAEIVNIALQYVGVPYVWAGASPSGFDCSGFVMYVFAKAGIRLPHSSAMQYGYGTHISKSELKPGDLVFFYNPIHHVGIYIGDGQMINARTGGVRIDSAFWSSYAGATRILE